MSQPGNAAGRVVLIGWDAADWALINPLLDAGLMPNLRSLVERGVMGKIETLQPPLSPLLWTSIATGKTADQHGILGFLEPDPAGGGVRVSSSSSRRVKALWNILDQSGKRSLVLNWYASQPAEPINGVIVSNAFQTATSPHHTPWRIVPRSVHPPELQETLADLRMHPGELTGDDLRQFIPNLAAIDQNSDRRPLQLAMILAEMLSVHAATTWLVEHEPWHFLAVYHGAIDLAGHYFMRFRAPQMEGVSAQDFENYKEVMNGVYCFHDMMLGRIVQLAGPDAAIVLVSDHGFESGRFRPLTDHGTKDDSPLMWHRSHGVLCMAGPGIRPDELVHGAGLLDIAPTILAMFGLPAAADMPGRVLAEAFTSPAIPERIPTWEDGKPHDTGESLPDDFEATAVMMQQLADLGYVDPISDDAVETLRLSEKANKFALAQVYVSTGRPDEAIPLLEALSAAAKASERTVMRLYLAQALFAARRLEECKVVVEDILAAEPNRPAAHAIRGNLALAMGDSETGLASLLKAEKEWKDSPRLKLLIGGAYLRTRKWMDAERCFRAVIAFDSDMAEAHAGLARSLMEQRRFRPAAAAALGAVGLKFNLPGSHYVLGASLAQLGQKERAIQAFETCLKLAPDTEEARSWLTKLQAAH